MNVAIVISLLGLSSFVKCCENRADTVDVGWNNDPNCPQFPRKWPKYCEQKNDVKYNCSESCDTCGFDPFVDCVDSKGKKMNVIKHIDLGLSSVLGIHLIRCVWMFPVYR